MADDMEREPETVHAQLWPTSWQVQCPGCHKLYAVDQVCEGLSGEFCTTDEDQFICCEECELLLEVDGVVLTPKERARG